MRRTDDRETQSGMSFGLESKLPLEYEWEIVDEDFKGSWREVYEGVHYAIGHWTKGRSILNSTRDNLRLLRPKTATFEVTQLPIRASKKIVVLVSPNPFKQSLFRIYGLAVQQKAALIAAVENRINDPQFANALDRLMEDWHAVEPEKPSELPTLIVRAEQLISRGHIDAALDLIYQNVEVYLQEGRLDDLDRVLSQIPKKGVSLDTLITLLTATLPVRGKLKTRKQLFDAAAKVARESGAWDDTLLAGLED